MARPADAWPSVGTLKTQASAQVVRGTASGARGTLGKALNDLQYRDR